MMKLDDLKTLLYHFSARATDTVGASIELLGAPRRFHTVRKRRRNTRLSESMRFAVVASVLMTAIYFLTVNSVAKVSQPATFLVAGSILNLGHLLAMSAIFGIVGRLVLPDVPLKLHVENVLYATALLPILSFFAQPLMDAQLRAFLADTEQFAFGYRPLLAAIMSSSTAAQISNWLVLFGYAAFAVLVHIGLRVTASVTHWRATAVVVPAMIGILFYQSLVVLSSTQQFVHAMTR